jgi:hypothetical protein
MPDKAMEIDFNVVINMVLQQNREIEELLKRKIIDLQLQLISANQRIAELEPSKTITPNGHAAVAEPETIDF